MATTPTREHVGADADADAGHDRTAVIRRPLGDQ
jgi:hypothetical protein